MSLNRNYHGHSIIIFDEALFNDSDVDIDGLRYIGGKLIGTVELNQTTITGEFGYKDLEFIECGFFINKRVYH